MRERSGELTDIPPYTLDGVPDAEITTHRFDTADGLELSMLRFRRGTAGDGVLVVHGLTTSTDMFVMPEHRNLVTCLLDEGYDVWCLDFRMSNRHPYNLIPHHYTLDDCALFDFPPAVDLVRAHIGDRRLHVIAHCLGAATFAMSLAAGRIGGFTSVVLNSLALTPRVPWWSGVKLAVAPALLSWAGFERLDPRWGETTVSLRGRLLAGAVSAVHRECDVGACHLLSMMWGTGWPALYEHENLDERTHRRAADLFGATGLHYYRHLHRMVRAGSAITYRPHEPVYRELPSDYLPPAAALDVPILLTTGADNRVFADSNVECHRRLCELGATNAELAVFDDYGHQDIFMGRDAAADVFGSMLDFLARAP